MTQQNIKNPFNKMKEAKRGVSLDQTKIITSPRHDQMKRIINDTNRYLIETPPKGNENDSPYKHHSFSPTPRKKENNLLPLLKSSEYQSTKTLVLDLDETLIHSSYIPFSIKEDAKLKVDIDEQTKEMYVLFRPKVDDFLSRIGECYQEIIIFTASLPTYANQLIDLFDKKKVIKFRLFREQCTLINNTYVKELKRLGRNMKNVIIVDNNPNSFCLDNDNGIPIKSFYEDTNDKELIQIAYVLEKLAKMGDVRPLIKGIVYMNQINYDQAFELFKNKAIDEESEEEENTIDRNKNDNTLSNNISSQKTLARVKIFNIEKVDIKPTITPIKNGFTKSYYPETSLFDITNIKTPMKQQLKTRDSNEKVISTKTSISTTRKNYKRFNEGSNIKGTFEQNHSHHYMNIFNENLSILSHNSNGLNKINTQTSSFDSPLTQKRKEKIALIQSHNKKTVSHPLIHSKRMSQSPSYGCLFPQSSYNKTKQTSTTADITANQLTINLNDKQNTISVIQNDIKTSQSKNISNRSSKSKPVLNKRSQIKGFTQLGLLNTSNSSSIISGHLNKPRNETQSSRAITLNEKVVKDEGNKKQLSRGNKQMINSANNAFISTRKHNISTPKAIKNTSKGLKKSPSSSYKSKGELLLSSTTKKVHSEMKIIQVIANTPKVSLNRSKTSLNCSFNQKQKSNKYK